MPRLLLLATLLLSGCAAAEAPPEQAGPAGCPATVAVAVAATQRVPLAVPADPTAETTGRLVPLEPPTAARVCRYGPVPGDASPAPVALSGEASLTAGLERIPQDLLLPRDTGGGDVCTQALGPVTAYLLRLDQPDGVVWVSASQGANGCVDTTNGRFTSDVDRSDLLAASLDAGAWTVPPQVDADQRCVPERAGRLGQDTALLPAGSTSLVLCRVAGDGVTRRPATAAQQAELADLLDEPVAVPSTGSCTLPPGQEAAVRERDGGREQYEVVARYPAGPSVLLRVAPGCQPEVDNGSLAADLEPAASQRLADLLRTSFGGP